MSCWMLGYGCVFEHEQIQKATKGHQGSPGHGRVRPSHFGRLEVCGSALRPDDVVLHPFAQVSGVPGRKRWLAWFI